MEYVKYGDDWPWGKTLTLVERYGLGMVEISVTNGNGYAFLSGLKVHPSFRKQGRGNDLLKQAESEVLNTFGLHYVLLHVVPDSWVREWYERKGYTLFAHEEDGFVELIKYLQ